MPTYTIQLEDGRKVKVQANNPNDALAEANSFAASNPRRQQQPAQRGTRRPISTEIGQFLNEVNRNLPGVSELQAGLEVGRRSLREAGEGRGGYGLFRNGRMGPAFTDPKVAFAEARANQRAMSQDLNTRRPNAAAFTRGAAQAAPLLIPGGQGAALSPASPAVNMARFGVANAAAGATNRAVIGEGTAQERLARASNPAAIATDVALGGLVGRTAPSLASTRKRVRPEVQVLAREGVQMTPGQAIGGNLARMENASTSVPVLGFSVGEAKRRSVDSFNRAAAERALRPIGQKLSPKTETGSDAIQEVGDRLSQRYQQIVPKAGMMVNDPAVVQQLSDLSNITAEMTDQAKDVLGKIINQRLVKRIVNGRLTGETFKRIESELGEVAGRYTKSPDVSEQDVGRGINFVLQTLRDGLGRQNPAYAKALADTNKGWSRLATLESAASAPGMIGGIATPKGMRSAYLKGDKSVRRRATAQGRRPDQEFFDAGASVLPSNLPDSGTAERLIGNPVAALAGGGVGVANPAIGVPVAATILGGSAAYSRPAMDLFNRALQSNISRRDRELVLEQLGQLAAQNPQVRALYDQALSRLGYATQQPSTVNAMAGQGF
jgi:hypothetical protein